MFENFSIVFQQTPSPGWSDGVLIVVAPVAAAVLGAWVGARITNKAQEAIFREQRIQIIANDVRREYTLLASIIETVQATRHFNKASYRKYPIIVRNILRECESKYDKSPDWVGYASHSMKRCADILMYITPRSIPDPWSYSSEERNIAKPNFLAKCFELSFISEQIVRMHKDRIKSALDHEMFIANPNLIRQYVFDLSEELLDSMRKMQYFDLRIERFLMFCDLLVLRNQQMRVKIRHRDAK